MKKGLIPNGKRVLLKRITEKKNEEVTKSGIILAKEVKTKVLFDALVVAVGSEVPSNIKIGDTVIIKDLATDDVELFGEDFILVGSDLIMGVYVDLDKDFNDRGLKDVNYKSVGALKEVCQKRYFYEGIDGSILELNADESLQYLRSGRKVITTRDGSEPQSRF